MLYNLLVKDNDCSGANIQGDVAIICANTQGDVAIINPMRVHNTVVMSLGKLTKIVVKKNAKTRNKIPKISSIPRSM